MVRILGRSVVIVALVFRQKAAHRSSSDSTEERLIDKSNIVPMNRVIEIGRFDSRREPSIRASHRCRGLVTAAVEKTL